MELTVKERLLLLSILPQEGSFTTIKIIRKLREELSFSEEEHEELGFRESDGKVGWDEGAEKMKEVEIGLKATDVVAAALKELDRKNSLHVDHFSLFEKFVLDEEDG